MKAEEYWRECGYPQHSIMTEEQQRFIFAERYATYRLQFEREQQQSWMPTEEGWKEFPEAKWAAMDSDGEVWLYRSNPTPEDYSWYVGGDWHEYIKTVDPTHINWRQAKVQRPEGV